MLQGRSGSLPIPLLISISCAVRPVLAFSIYYNITGNSLALMDVRGEVVPGLYLFALRESLCLQISHYVDWSGALGKECFHASSGLDLPVL